MMIPKTARVELHGEKLKALCAAVLDRDGGKCIKCGAYVPEGTKPHHEPQGALKSDEINKMVTLCNKCHFNRHHSALAGELKIFCREYLQKIVEGVKKWI